MKKLLKNVLADILEWYFMEVGISFRIKPIKGYHTGNIKGKYSLACRHPYRSHTWIWAIYYNSNESLLKRFSLQRQEPLWKDLK